MTLNIADLEPGHSVVLESAFISDVSYLTGSTVRVLVVSSPQEGEATWWRFDVPRTTKSIRKFFHQYGVDPDLPKQGQYPNLVGQDGQRFLFFRTPVRVEGRYKGSEEVPTEEDSEQTAQVRDLEEVSMRLA